MKYIKTIDDRIIIFQEHISHDEFLKMFNKEDIISAGRVSFCAENDDALFALRPIINVDISGSSYSLNLEPDYEKDKILIEVMLSIKS